MALSAEWGSDHAGIMTKGMPISRERVIGWAFVGAQFLLIGALVGWHPRHRWSIPDALDTAAKVAAAVGLAWMAVGAVNLGRSLTALPLPLEHATLRVGGLYRLSRHPIYTGLITAGWSWALRAEAVGPLMLGAALTALLAAKVRFEEMALRAKFPEYARYSSRTPRFWPVGPLKRVRGGVGG